MYKGFFAVLGSLLCLGMAGVAKGQDLPDDLRWVKVADGLVQPLAVRNAGDARLFVVQQNGKIYIVVNGQKLDEPFLDIGSGGTAPPLGFTAGGERGLLGLAFHPSYSSNRFFYVYYTDGEGDTVVARYRRKSGNINRADPSSGRVVLRVDQTFANHNGGDIHFGRDGYLYIGLGDGGSGNDPCNRAQTVESSDLVNSGDCAADREFTRNGGDPDSRALLGKLLRIVAPTGTVNSSAGVCGAGGSDTGYRVPNDNPYAGANGGCSEIYALGLRNPYRFSVDRNNGDLWIGDVGQVSREEINRLRAGQAGLNFGWRCREGFIANPAVSCPNPPTFTDPVVDHPRDGRLGAQSITGGYRYRGPIRDLRGIVFYGDFVTGKQFALQQTNGNWQVTTWRNRGGNPSGYGEGVDGTLYMTDYGGSIFRLEATSGSTSPSPEDVIFQSSMESGESKP
jgi:glucose/arabinose dehydrogenase